MAPEQTPAQRLAAYCKAAPTDPYVIECATEAAEKIARVVLDAVTPPPASAVSRAVLEYGKELFDRRQSRNGIAGLDSPDFQPMRIARDPMKAALPFLLDYMGPAIA